jgi:hypothetical protein
MVRRPYKFLDAFEKEDHDIFFGRQREIEEIHSRLFYSNLLVLYGPSGTGKTSILKCGLTNRIPESDWKPLHIRRNANIIESIDRELEKKAQTPLKINFTLEQKLRSVYLDYLTPIFLIFDQLEELFVFGHQNEQQEFIRLITDITNDPETNVKVIFIIREEYLADLSGFEEMLPNIFDNRFRIERMGRLNLLEAIKCPADVCGVRLDDGLAEEAIEKITDEKGNTELTYVQVLMDHLYKVAEAREAENIHLQLDDLRKLGQLSNLMSRFLDDQLLQINNAKAGEEVLKTMISLDGTKKPMRISDIQQSLQQLNKKVDNDQLLNIVQYFVNVRILREKDENGFYELRHDSLAYRIYERMTLVEKELIEVQQFLRQAFERYKRHRILLRKEDLAYIAPYEAKLIPEREINEFLLLSKKALMRSTKRKRNIAITTAISILLILSGFTIWALKERRIADRQKKKAIIAMHAAEQSEKTATNAYQLAEEEIYRNIKASLVVSADNMNILYVGIWNPLSITVSGLPSENLSPSIVKGNADLRGENGFYEIKPNDIASEVQISVHGFLPTKENLKFESKTFLTKRVPSPIISIAGKNEGVVTLEELRGSPRLIADMPDFYFKGVECKVQSFELTWVIGNFISHNKITGEYIPDKLFDQMDKHLKEDESDSKLFIEKILYDFNIEIDDGKDRAAPPIVFEIVPENFDVDKKRRSEAVSKLLFASAKEFDLKNFDLSYRFAEAAFIIDPNRDDAIRTMFESYHNAFADVIKYYEFSESSAILFSENFDFIIEIFGSDSNQLLCNLFKVYPDSLQHIKRFEYVDSRFDKFRYNALLTNEYFVLSRLISNEADHIENIMSVFNFDGELIIQDTIAQRSGRIERSFSNDHFISNPSNNHTIIGGEYDNRSSLWSSKDGFVSYLWGEQKFSRLENISNQLITNCFINSDYSNILGWESGNRTLNFFDIEGKLTKSIITPAILYRAFTTPDQQIFYYGKQIHLTHLQTNQLFKVDNNFNHEELFDSLVSFSYSLNGEYLLFTRLNKNDEPYSLLYDSNMNLIAEYPIWIPNGIIRVDIENNCLVHIDGNDSGRMKYFTFFPLDEAEDNLVKIVNEKKLFGSVKRLKPDDLNNYFISDDYSEKILQFYQRFD